VLAARISLILGASLTLAYIIIGRDPASDCLPIVYPALRISQPAQLECEKSV
jgi:hypothetical protein